ncbi:MAG: hypothetical protein C5B54_11500 [Acidobacteria bacterium]|nr:MAG: hypothetical protein C5B54_11500 [Acidobacteriota bacterium]
MGTMNGEEIHDDYSQEETEAAQPWRLTVFHAIGLVILFLISEAWVQLILVKGAQLQEDTWVFAALTSGIAGAVTALAGAFLAGYPFAELFRFPQFRWFSLLPIAVSVIGLTILSQDLGNLLQSLDPMAQEYLDFINKLAQQNTSGLLFTVMVIAPLTEELIFRGVIFEGLRERYHIITALLLSSLLFGLAHIIPSLVLNAFFIGLFLAWVKLRTDSLIPCLFAHALYNGIPFLADKFITIKIPGFTASPDPTAIQFQPLWFDALGLLLLLLGIAGLWWWSKRNKPVY